MAIFCDDYFVSFFFSAHYIDGFGCVSHGNIMGEMQFLKRFGCEAVFPLYKHVSLLAICPRFCLFVRAGHVRRQSDHSLGTDPLDLFINKKERNYLPVSSPFLDARGLLPIYFQTWVLVAIALVSV